MDEQKNPLKPCLPLPSHLLSGGTSNKGGRPSTKNIVKFGPQPKSMVAQLLNKIRTSKTNDYDKNKGYIDINLAIEVNDDLINFNEEHKLSPNCLPLTSTLCDDKTTNGMINKPKHNLIEANSQSNTTVLEKKNCTTVSNIVNAIHVDGNAKKMITSEIAVTECSTHKINSTNEDNACLIKHKAFLCSFPNCDYSCKFSSNLIKHRRVHTNEKPYLCDKCCFRSNFVNSLKAHKRTHTAERPYQCVHCSYKCNSSSNLKKHCLHRHSNCYVNADKP